MNHLSNIAAEDEKPYHLFPVSSGEVHDVSKTIRVRIVDCFHTVDTVGYCFYLLRPKLKKEYEALAGSDIAKLRKSGVSVTEDIELPQFVFLGDTTARVFAAHEALLATFHVVIVECTHLFDEHAALAEPSGHMHWKSVEAAARKMPNTTFVLIHWSARYKMEEIVAFFADLGERKPANVMPWVSGIR